ncbi:uncharacterized protein LOC132701269 [Cylas formicarius]|uniref:uncharacterized protein LOC132701269 n=1 Tax=Cylas formicarius TaxID=197179 RepID=UPI002958CF69|nr:uncharacterized protein LOC132701269 [Cylas formicarius]
MFSSTLNLVIFLVVAKETAESESKSPISADHEAAFSDKIIYQVLPPNGLPYSIQNNENGIRLFELQSGPQTSPYYNFVTPQIPTLADFHGNPLLSALLLSSSLGIPTYKYQGFNHPDHLPVNPYIALLLSQYGRYLPINSLNGKGIYYYGASNNYHNNKPFGSYKVFEESK